MFAYWVVFFLLGFRRLQRVKIDRLTLFEHQHASRDASKNLSPSDFLLDRTVHVRSLPWVQPGRGILPLHIYRGVNLRNQQQNGKATMASLDPIFSSSDDSFISMVRNMTTLSTSATAMLEEWETLSSDERHRVRNKIAAEKRASTPLNPMTDLHILHHDADICVVNKPSGVLSVPGPRRNPSLANLVYDIVTTAPDTDIDQMVVHRLDMDTSGILAFALNTQSLSILHHDFRGRRVKKTYQALLVGHLLTPEVDIDIDLERDPLHVPFMRAAQPKPQLSNSDDGKRQEQLTLHPSFRKMMNQAPKPSKTELRVLSWEYLENTALPVTRVELVPHTGRTHQLRVHCAALGYPIVGDDIYGYYKAAGDCGIPRDTTDADLQLHQQIYDMQIPLCLHARELTFYHPRTGAPVVFDCAPPF